ncbi:MAG: hypothetical protein F4169_20530 [Gammaproteobacteria bacterium]|nr:hypothetical protein [Gammaproteobacteria bacterium]
MAANVSPGDVAVAIRAATDAEQVAAPVLAVITSLVAAASAIIEAEVPDATIPLQTGETRAAAIARVQPVKNAAVVRLTGFLYDTDPADPAPKRPMIQSGAAALLAPWRTHRAGAIGQADATGGTTPPATPGAGLPPLPGEGDYILGIQNGELVWVEFPLP